MANAVASAPVWRWEVEALVQAACADLWGGSPLAAERLGVRIRRSSADWSTTAALALAPAGAVGAPHLGPGTTSARARALSARLAGHPAVASAVAAPTGHVNVVLTDQALGAVVPALLALGAAGAFPGAYAVSAAAGPGRAGGPAGRTGGLGSDAGGGVGDLEDARLAHARTRSTARSAQAHGVRRAESFDPALLQHVSERALLLALADVGATRSAEDYLAAVTTAHRAWFEATRVSPRGQGKIEPVHRTRLWLNDAVTVALAQGLHALHLDAPEHL